MAAAVGIDLGTTYSCVAAIINGRVEVIDGQDYGHRTTPSCVAFVDGEDQALVGEAALRQVARNPANTVVDAKRLIGRQYRDQSVQDDMKRWPFKVTSSNGDPRIHVTHNGHPKVLSPQEVSAMVLRKLKQSAEARLGHAVTEAVITVPAYFTDSQKKATREAGEMAGLKVLRLLPEPTAAALAYGHGLKDNVTEKTVLIYDLGGGTFDVSIVTVSRGRFVVRGVGGNSHLGGTDIDQIILKHAAQEVLRTTAGKRNEPRWALLRAREILRNGRTRRAMRHDVTGNPSKMRRLLERCERAKRDLSTQSRCDIDTESIVPDELPLPLSRDELEELCRDVLRSTTDTVKSVLATAKMAAADISEVILVGGSTRMPVVERLLSEVFPGKPVCKTVNPDEAVAQGAALYALHLLQDKAPDVQEPAPFLRRLDIQNVTPLSVGVECNGGMFGVIIPRNTAIPVRKEERRTTMFNNQTAVSFSVFQGERLVAKHNKFIGEFVLKDLPRAPAGLGMDVALSIDMDGILSVEAKAETSDKWERCTLQMEESPTAEILGNLEDAERHREEDQREVDRLMKMCELECYIISSGHEAHGKAKAALEEADIWCDKNLDAAIDVITSKLEALKTAVESAAK